jgi:hypothetical protein
MVQSIREEEFLDGSKMSLNSQSHFKAARAWWIYVKGISVVC